MENLRHWKENCAALGYDSDGEELSQVSPADGLDGRTRRETKEVCQVWSELDLDNARTYARRKI